MSKFACCEIEPSQFWLIITGVTATTSRQPVAPDTRRFALLADAVARTKAIEQAIAHQTTPQFLLDVVLIIGFFLFFHKMHGHERTYSEQFNLFKFLN